MKAQKFNRFALLLPVIFTITVLAAAGQKKTKEVTREFGVSEDTRLVLQNKFGNVDVKSWDKNTISLNITISADHPKPDIADRMLENISIEIKEEDNLITVRTVFDEKFSKIGMPEKGPAKKPFSVDYLVQLPAEVPLSLSNRFGNVYINELSGQSNIEVSYGRLEADRLLHGPEKPRSTVTLAFGGGFINESNWLALEVKHSNLNLGKSQALVLEARHSQIGLEEASSLVSESEHTTLKIGTLNNLVISGSFNTIDIDRITKKLKTDTKYGKCTVRNVDRDFESVMINASFTTHHIGIDPGASYLLSGEAQFSKIIYPETGTVSKNVGNTSMSVSGQVGRDKPDGSEVKITTRYGDVRLTR